MFFNYYTENLIMRDIIYTFVIGWKNYKVVGKSLMLDLVELERELIGMNYNHLYNKWTWLKPIKSEIDIQKKLIDVLTE